MLRSINVLFVVALVLLLVMVFDPQARADAASFWQELRSVLDQVKVQVSLVLEQIAPQSRNLPATDQKIPPPYDGPIFNTNLGLFAAG